MDTNAKLETFRDEFVLLSNSRPPPVTWAGDTPLPITPTSRPTSFTVRSRLARRWQDAIFFACKQAVEPVVQAICPRGSTGSALFGHALGHVSNGNRG